MAKSISNISRLSTIPISLLEYDSKCYITEENRAYLLETIFKNKKMTLTLYYRSSRDGQNPNSFHLLCDNKGPTISLYKIKDGDCIGAFTNAEWQENLAEDEIFKSDKSAILFNLYQKRFFPIQCDKKALVSYSGYGPSFGDAELFSVLKVNEEITCKSNENRNTFKIPIDN